MTRPAPDAPFCTLGPQALSERIALIRTEILPYAKKSEKLFDGRAWDFPNTAELRAKLEELVELERECCRERVRFELHRRADDRILRLEVHGIAPDAEILVSLA